MAMVNLIVNKGDNRQEVIQIDPSGDYLSKEDVIWDERTDGALTDDQLSKVGGFTRVDGQLVFDQAKFDANQTPSVPRLAEIAAALTGSEDIQVAAILALAKMVNTGLNQLRLALNLPVVPFETARAVFLNTVADILDG